MSDLKLRSYQLEEIDKVRKSFKSGKNRPLAVLPCGAGKTVLFGYMSSRHIAISPDNNVLFLVHRKELVNQTKETFDKFGITDPRISIRMVQSVTRRVDKINKPTLIVVDEAHHATTGTYTNIINAFPDTPIVGLTATPCRLDGTGLGSVFDDMKIGVTAKWLIENGYLAHYKYFAPHINIEDANFAVRGSDFDTEDVANKLDDANIYGDISKYLNFKNKTIIYCPTVEFSKKVATLVGPLAAHFDGDTPDEKRKQITADFKSGKIRVLCNCSLIGEGFDVPDCDTVMLLRPTKSVALYIQQAMRCMRPNGSKIATIYDFVGNCYRHGMPDDDREWSLTGKTKCKNESGEKEVTCRECKCCHRIYAGVSRICPYCGFDNGKTQAEIKIEKEKELEQIIELKKKEERKEQGRCQTFGELVNLAKKRGYKNPSGWAYFIMKSRER